MKRAVSPLVKPLFFTLDPQRERERVLFGYMKESFNYAENLNKRTKELKDKLKKGGDEALEAHFELNKLAEEAEYLIPDAKKDEVPGYKGDLFLGTPIEDERGEDQIFTGEKYKDVDIYHLKDQPESYKKELYIDLYREDLVFTPKMAEDGSKELFNHTYLKYKPDQEAKQNVFESLMERFGIASAIKYAKSINNLPVFLSDGSILSEIATSGMKFLDKTTQKNISIDDIKGKKVTLLVKDFTDNSNELRYYDGVIEIDSSGSFINS